MKWMMAAFLVGLGLFVTPVQAADQLYKPRSPLGIRMCDSYSVMKLGVLLERQDHQEAQDWENAHDGCVFVGERRGDVFHVMQTGALGLVQGYFTDAKGKLDYRAGWTTFDQLVPVQADPQPNRQ